MNNVYVSAKQARSLVEESDQYVDKFIRSIDNLILTASKDGKNSIRVDELHGVEFYCCKPTTSFATTHKSSPLLILIVQHYKKQGFSASVEVFGDTYVPKGLANDMGEGEPYQSTSLCITW